ncbi:Maf family protein [Pseudoalteromonas tunicata]|uniref:Maf family protein n=1 Tax=Pseudoalteromonas tunicata TaxID=314281 RepID=UPI00273DC1F4|nr:Maf family protein [Pseudoalteromonas tunicata]MDP5214107.1 Maf family protein [Pseudoalteromonas tunicata]
MTARIILASTSVFRQSLLKKFNLPFETASPDVDESALPNETAPALVERLALYKAQAVAKNNSNAIIIGSDQVALFNKKILGKPHTKENAIAQLTAFSGQKVTFLTGLALINSHSGEQQTTVEPFDVYFRTLTLSQIEHYVDAEQPFQCAGSFKSEGLGICLFERFEGRDPNSLIGLPLMALNEMLLNWKIDILALQQRQG